MIVGLGVDVVEIERVDLRIAEKVLTESEIELLKASSDPRQFLAGRFALKEAFFKALGTGLNGHSFKDVEFLKDDLGRPILRVKRDFSSVFNFAHISLSHDLVAVAVVVIERRRGGIFVMGNPGEFEIITRKGDLVEIDSSFGPFETARKLKKSGAKLVKYGNIWEAR